MAITLFVLFTSRRLTKNRPPLICRYLEKHLSSGSVWNRDVSTKSYPSCKRSSIKAAVHLRVVTNAWDVCVVNAYFCDLDLYRSCQPSIQSANARRKRFFFIIFYSSVSKGKTGILSHFTIANRPPNADEFQKFGCVFSTRKVFSDGNGCCSIKNV